MTPADLIEWGKAIAALIVFVGAGAGAAVAVFMLIMCFVASLRG